MSKRKGHIEIGEREEEERDREKEIVREKEKGAHAL